MKGQKFYECVSKKSGTKLYGRTEGDRRNEPDTATLMVGKQHAILLCRRKINGE